jgi:CRISPR-associated protein Cas1
MKTLYIYETGAVLTKKDGKILVRKEGIKLYDEPINAVESVVISKNTQITGQLMNSLMEKGIPVHYVKRSGALIGSVIPNADSNIFLRFAQYDAWRNNDKRLISKRQIASV